jgi:predicted aminopeptidase
MSQDSDAMQQMDFEGEIERLLAPESALSDLQAQSMVNLLQAHDDALVNALREDLQGSEDKPGQAYAEVEERRRAIERTFTPWFQDPIEIARLLRFLELIDETPRDVACFVEHAETWADMYETMLAAESRP